MAEAASESPGFIMTPDDAQPGMHGAGAPAYWKLTAYVYEASCQYILPRKIRLGLEHRAAAERHEICRHLDFSLKPLAEEQEYYS